MTKYCDIKSKKEKKLKNPYRNTHKFINGEEYKLCLDCNEFHPMNAEWFHKNKSSLDGFNPYCKEKARERSLKRYLTVKEDDDLRRKEFYWANREHYQERQKEYDNKRKNEKKEYLKDWQKVNREKLYEYTKNRNEHKKHEISDQEWEFCKHYFDNSCSYCGLHVDIHLDLHYQDLHREHAIDTGANDISNCIPACKSCNASKRNKDYDEWYTENNEKFNIERLNKIIKWLEGDYELAKIPI